MSTLLSRLSRFRKRGILGRRQVKLDLLLIGSIALAVFAILHQASPAKADACYTLINGSNLALAISYTYPGTVDPNPTTPLSNTYPAGATVKNTWCFADGTSATVTITSGQVWNPGLVSALIMGNGGSAPGTYSAINHIPVGWPGHEKYSVLSVHYRDVNYVWGNCHNFCGLHHIMDASIICKNGEKWNLVCTSDGSKCNVNEHEWQFGLTQWNVGQHCDGAHGDADSMLPLDRKSVDESVS